MACALCPGKCSTARRSRWISHLSAIKVSNCHHTQRACRPPSARKHFSSWSSTLSWQWKIRKSQIWRIKLSLNSLMANKEHNLWAVVTSGCTAGTLTRQRLHPNLGDPGGCSRTQRLSLRMAGHAQLVDITIPWINPRYPLLKTVIWAHRGRISSPCGETRMAVRPIIPMAMKVGSGQPRACLSIWIRKTGSNDGNFEFIFLQDWIWELSFNLV
jgi:hypothetical protein